MLSSALKSPSDSHCTQNITQHLYHQGLLSSPFLTLQPHLLSLFLQFMTLQHIGLLQCFHSRNTHWPLTGVAQWVGHYPASQGVTGSIPRQGTCLGCRPGPWLGTGVQEMADRCFSLSPSFPFLKSKNKTRQRTEFCRSRSKKNTPEPRKISPPSTFRRNRALLTPWLQTPHLQICEDKLLLLWW